MSGRAWSVFLILNFVFAGLAGSPVLAMAAAPTNLPVRHVIIVSIDGLGADLLAHSRARHLNHLQATESSAVKAVTVDPPLTVPSHVSMLTGVEPSRHGITHNQLDDELVQLKVPSIFDLAHQNKLRTAAVVGKAKLKFVFDTGTIDHMVQPDWWLGGEMAGRFPSLMEDAAIDEMKEHKPAVLWVHYALVDTIGHWFQWESLPQKLAIHVVDASLFRLLEETKKIYRDEPFAVIITADHGGHKGSHGQRAEGGQFESPETDLEIPFIVIGAKIRDDVPLVHIYDVAPTAAHLLGLTVPPEWQWQGESVVR